VCGIDRRHLAQQHVHIPAVAGDGANRRRDLGGGQAGGGDLIQQRLEQMVVALVDQRDVHRRSSQ
jgi:hypothetical protein